MTTPAQTPLRDANATTNCPVCGTAFVVFGRRRYCSDRCRRAGWARRHQVPPTPVVVPAPAGARRPLTVYECVRHEREGGAM